MKKTIKIILFCFCVSAFLLILATKTSANSINQIAIDAYIDKFGNATVTEVWNANLTQGTEGYRIYGDLGKSTISNFTVSDDSGRTYETLANWNKNTNFNNKAYKCGINNTSNGLELCWGISSYGTRTYILKYDISNFVTQYVDTQGIYFNFLNLYQQVNNVKITIRSDELFSKNNSEIWAFGYNGTINFNDGSIVLNSGGRISESQYMVALVKFKDNIFETTNTSKLYFKNEYDATMYEVELLNRTAPKVNTIELHSIMLYPFLIFLGVALVLFVLTIIISAIVREKLSARTRKKPLASVKYGEYGKKLPEMKDIEYWRDIPCNGNLGYVYWLCIKYSIVSETTLRKNILGSILLKWIKNGYITILNNDKLKRNNYAIDFTNMLNLNNVKFGNFIENNLFQIFSDAMGVGYPCASEILEVKKFRKWCKNNYKRIDSWLNDILNGVQYELCEKGLITEVVEERKGIFGETNIIQHRTITNELRDEAIKIKGLKKFLLDFGTMKEKEFIDVHIWENYLVFAQLFGIAKKVEKQFNEAYPNFNYQTILNTDILVTKEMSSLCYRQMKVGLRMHSTRDMASTIARSSSDDYSTGGGGRSYSSGGSSARGSRGGGFR